MTTKAESVQSKIEAISKKFDVAESLIGEDVQELAEPVLNHKEKYHPIDVMSLENMVEDFRYSRKVLKETISYGRKVLQKITLDSLTEKKINTMGFAEVLNSLLQGVKVHSQLYKDFSTVLVNIKKLQDDDTPKDKESTDRKPISTIDLIQQLKDSDK